ncbi:sugar ABC transporter permease [Micromonospora sp. NBC_01813]|uniref:sugar ABC transporter permease n=1 Tax=Micromonospora sp. NBC_01813 TaxID=2975988 RepID=UPI002DDA2897|nr:sugar ABC transporter permease [Micromonospora sp. NBC_01813]WSA10293.1 sugar ABC transporter permease [Micromonospora sp. NBC_01813]
MTSTIPPTTAPTARLGSGARIGIALALLLPALLALAWSYALPTLLAVRRSTTRDNLLAPPQDVGGANYQARLEQGFIGELGLALLLAVVPLVLALLVAPVLAALADRAGRRARLATRALLAVPVAGYAPVALLVGWRLDRIDPVSAVQQPAAALVALSAVSGAGLIVAVATTAFLGTLRGRRRPVDALPAAGVVGGLLLLGITATALQSFTAPLLISSATGRTPLAGSIAFAFARMELGLGSAGAVLLLGPLMLLGLAATALLLASRARIEVATADVDVPAQVQVPIGGDARTGGGGRPARIVLAVAGGVFVGLLLWGAWPWLRRSLRFTNDVAPFAAPDLSATLLWTWLPPLLSTVVAVGVAAVAGFAIGGLRPFGRFSELLLVPFAPWLFVGTGPLAIESYLRTRDLGQLDTFLGLVPPGWVSVPALFAFTLLFRGLEPRWRAGGGFGRTMIAPAAPMVVLAGLLTWLVGAGQVLWPWLVAQSPTTRPAPLEAFAQSAAGRVAADELALGAVLPLPLMLLFLAAFVGLQLGYLDRLAIRTGGRPGGGPAAD